MAKKKPAGGWPDRPKRKYAKKRRKPKRPKG
jgi:hypothetical protein